MELRDGEKLILIMLSEIHEHLKIQGEIDPRLANANVHVSVDHHAASPIKRRQRVPCPANSFLIFLTCVLFAVAGGAVGSGADRPALTAARLLAAIAASSSGDWAQASAGRPARRWGDLP